MRGLVCCLGVALRTRDVGIANLYMLFFFESISYLVSRIQPFASPACPAWLGTDQVASQYISSLGTRGLRRHMKRGSRLIVTVCTAIDPFLTLSSGESCAGCWRRCVVSACAGRTGRQVLPGPTRQLRRDDIICCLFPPHKRCYDSELLALDTQRPRRQ